MTLGQAASRGFARLRRPSWEPSKCIELELYRDENGKLLGSVGPWVKLCEAGTEQTFLIFTFNEDEDWEPVEDPTPPDPQCACEAGS
ncbi:MAG TPA: hypothetical protein VMH81_13490 [Bryobacteraceae bacterium]|nr:hypothetical protein [Bryobacteraceae bacterium]